MITETKAPGVGTEGKATRASVQSHDSTSWPANTGSMDALPVAIRELAELPQWVFFKMEDRGDKKPDGSPKLTKVPYNPRTGEKASTTAPATWTDYPKAVAAMRRCKGDGVGFVFNPETTPVMGVDLDGCITPEGLTQDARDIVELLDSYTEITPSGTGLHILAAGELPPGARRKGSIEAYTQGRFFTVTGLHYAGTPETIESRTAELADFHGRYLAKAPKKAGGIPITPLKLEDQDILDLAFDAKNGAAVKALYNGDTTGYASESEADAALLARLVFYTRDPAQLTRLLKGSRLRAESREKWERQDYLDKTVTAALDLCSETYSPPYAQVSGNGRRPPTTGDDAKAPAAPDDAHGEGDELHTDMGNAERFIRLHGDNVRWVPLWSAWAVFDGKRWRKDTGLEAERRAKATAEAMMMEAVAREDMPEKDRNALFKHALKTQDAKRLRDMLVVARSAAVLHLEDLDKDPFLLNCQNGTLDLRTGTLRPHRREDFLSKITATEYDPTAQAPTWHKCLDEWLPDKDLQNYFQEAMGYALTGSVEYQCFFFLYGSGANGKSTAMNTGQGLLGDYAQTARPEVLMQKKGDAGIGNEIAELKGARLVITSEPNKAKPFDEAQMKQLTGGEKRRGRHLFQNSFEYSPTDKIFLQANHKPRVTDLSHAFWRRVKLIPWLARFDEAHKDPALEKKLQAEWPGILAWAVEGWLRLQARGRLEDPAMVTEAVDTYRTESDILGDYVAERCTVSPMLTVTLKELYADYLGWCAESKEQPGRKGEFKDRLSNMDGISVSRGNANAMTFRGIALSGSAITGELMPPEESEALTPPEIVI